jgi:hypothetical protein
VPVPVSLEGCYERIARARENLDGLNRDIAVYLDSEPAQTTLKADIEDGRQVVEFEVLKDPPMRLSLMLGEVGYNLRAALDHLVFQLAVWNGAPNPDEDRTQFPIFTNHAHYYGATRKAQKNSWRVRMLKGLSTQHRTMIDGEQPYQLGRGAKDSALVTLAWFSDKDKHRIHHAAMLTMLGSNVTIHGGGLEAVEIYAPYTGAATKISTEKDEAGRATYRIRFPTSHGGVNMQSGALKVTVGFGDRLIQTPTFYWVADEVERIVQKFVPTVGA